MSDAVQTAESPAAESIEQIAAKLFVEDAPAQETAAVAESTPDAKAPPEPAKDPVAERASARILANQKAEMRAAKLRAEMAATQADLEAKKSEVGELAKLAESVKAAKLSPSKALELLGMSPKEFLETLASEHEPDAVARREVSGALTEVQQIKAELAALKAEKAEETKRARMQAAEAEAQQAGSGFLEFLAGNADKYPNLIEVMDPQEIVNAGFACLHEVIGKDHGGRPVTRLDAYMAEHGKPPDDDEIAEFLEAKAAPRAQARTEWRSRIGKKAPEPSQGTSDGVRATQLDRGPSPRTLTSRAASEKAAATPQWSQEAADEESLRIIRAAFSKG